MRKICLIQPDITKMRHKYNWSQATYNSIDWRAHSTILNNMPYEKKVQIRKFIHRRLPVGKLNFQLDTLCPYCGCDESHCISYAQDHIFLCTKNRKAMQYELNDLTKQI